MVTKIFQLLLLLSPICFGSNINMDMFDIIFFRTGIIALFAAAMIDNPRRTLPGYAGKSIALLLGLCIVNIFIHNFTPVVLHTTMNLFLALTGVFIVYTYYDESKDLRKFILWAGLINLVFFINQKMGFNPIFDKMPYVGQEGAFLGNQPRLMTYFALITPFLWWPFLIVSLALGIYTQQIIIFAPVAICLFAKLKTGREKIIYGIMILTTMLLLKDKIYAALSFRFNMAWKPVLNAFFDRPLIGYGIGVRIIPELEVVGNSYLQFIIGAGLAGAVWFGYVFKNIYGKLNNNIESIALISLIIIMTVEYPIEITRLWYLIMGIITMWLLKNHSREVNNV